MRILIVGCGSIGTRHLKAFKKIKEVEPIFGNSRFCFLKKDLIKSKNKMVKFD